MAYSHRSSPHQLFPSCLKRQNNFGCWVECARNTKRHKVTNCFKTPIQLNLVIIPFIFVRIQYYLVYIISQKYYWENTIILSIMKYVLNILNSLK